MRCLTIVDRYITEVVGQRLGGLLEKQFLFASLIPTALFFAASVVTFAAGVGLAGTLTWLEGLSALSGTMLLIAIGITLIVLSYVLASLRPTISALWSGIYRGWPPPPFRAHLSRSQDRRYRDLSERAEKLIPSVQIKSALIKRVHATWKPELPPASEAEVQKLQGLGQRLLERRSVEEGRSEIEEIESLYHRYAPKSLEPAWKPIVDTLEAQGKAPLLDKNDARVRLERWFGPQGTLRPTALGNLLEAHTAYPFRRYAIEGSVFWPRLTFVVAPETLARKIHEEQAGADQAVEIV
jgi:hypothetical protein